MKKPRLGIIGGAGPMAGALLFQKIIRYCQENYGCKNDSDFPYILLLSYPFSDMLSLSTKKDVVETQLKECFFELIKNDIQVAVIACNTLHAFLQEMNIKIQFINMLEVTTEAIQELNLVETIVLCSTTSRKCKLHNRYFPCLYFDDQAYLQSLINKILEGKHSLADAELLSQKLNAILPNSFEKTGLVLGCTEFSVLNEQFPLHLTSLSKQFFVLDTNQIAAERICKLIFKI